ncbi:MAG: hypothetical protein A2499_09120 [Stygiobacter sp. RIFOXYC12_FULL_38_8]|nr:MAG: hypothetical protein A2X62_16885 [Stygiobacter sp. GWC2_38_9]OGU77914.1 MAG: hypothetical protein A2279_02895 [Stygiobacter sp. RIFOXYA12_FULL_38_9]OGV09037.1 MAG: hypothetical protein A2299_11440 [Stygiobacter sp. RIFOXYB2_FULL_37_11]OGV14148.1 MAG: hypothetical protein A2237_13430 [Stygiobacter sp. RIFOXYA2_FULL_38_8]OGV16263.1 MAG: hypothetical protein A2440_04345 [Stygiobacter sp. RIFOXYC2_FULL_38_25]OGV28616.1 MAG: hypothetical protein A2499_09120 [Stygiobacter sp. RIFOXYC12_FULL_
MELSIGKLVKYNFPLPKHSDKQSFIGVVENIGETFLTVRNEQNTLLKISYKNFDNVELIDIHSSQYSLYAAFSLL